VNEFVNLEGQKLSTSRGWVIWLHEMLEDYDPDLIRYYAAIIAPENKDSDFRWKDFQAKINNELVATLGNFIHRVLLFVYTKFGGIVPEPGVLEPQDKELLENIERLAAMFKNRVENCRFKSGLKIILELAQLGNKYLNDMKPWAVVENAPRATYIAMQVVKALCILMVPYLPFTAHKLMNILNLNLTPETTRWEEFRIPIKPQHKINKPEPLFRKVTDEEISKHMAKLNLT
jgi:methionyl-tRNA synthetase